MLSKYFFTILILLVCIAGAHSQSDDPSDKIYSASLSLSGLYQSGNTYKFIVQGKADVKRVTEELEMILTGTWLYGENRGRKDDNSYFGSFTTDVLHKRTFSFFVLQYLEYNFAKGINIRSQSGGGIKYLFVKDTNHTSSVSLALIYDYINLFNTPPDARRKAVRLSYRFKTKQVLISERLLFYGMIMYQPIADYYSDYNLFIDTSLEIPLTDILRINAIYSYAFSDIVSVGRKSADNKLTFGVGIYF